MDEDWATNRREDWAKGGNEGLGNREEVPLGYMINTC